MATLTPRKVAIFPWGDVIEEFLDPLGLTAEDFATRMSGGWLFGYVAALATQQIDSVIVYGSERIRQPKRLQHAETGAPIWLVPARRSGQGVTAGNPNLRSLAQWLRTPVSAFAGLLRREGCDGVIVQDYEHPRFDALAGLARLMGLPVLATFQGGDHTASPLEGRARNLWLRLCRRLIVPSARERDRLAATYRLGPERLVDIPNPVDTAAWRASDRAEARARLGVADDAFLVVNHGRIDMHRKGLDVILAAFARLRAEVPRARLVLIGSGQDDEAFAPLAAAADGVDWIRGYVTDPPMIRGWLSAADAYLTLSRVEGMPVAPLEAMACGLPVVASDAHGLADIFREGEASGGLLVPREDGAAAGDALRRLAASPAERARLGAAARRTVEGRYAIPAVGEALAQALRPQWKNQSEPTVSKAGATPATLTTSRATPPPSPSASK